MPKNALAPLLGELLICQSYPIPLSPAPTPGPTPHPKPAPGLNPNAKEFVPAAQMGRSTPAGYVKTCSQNTSREFI